MRRATLSHPPRFRLVERRRGWLKLAADDGTVAFLFVLEDDIMRLLLLAGGIVTSPPGWAIAPGLDDLPEPGRDRLSVEHFSCPEPLVEIDDTHVTVATSRLRVTIGLDGMQCHWEQRNGDGWRVMQRDRRTQAYDFGWWDGRAHHYVERAPGERYFGLGEKTGPLDRAGRRYRMLALDPMGYDPQRTDPLYKSIPWLLVTQADGCSHGCFYDSVAEATIDLGAEIDNYHGPYRHFVAEAGDLDIWMIAGPAPADVVRRFTWLTGRPAAMPDWALSYSGSTMSYTEAPDAQRRMAEFLTKTRDFDIPCRSFHLSSGYTSIGDRRYVFTWNRDKFPDPADFATSFARAGVRLVANVKPVLLRDHPLFPEAEAAGLFVTDDEGAPLLCQFWDGLGAYIDFTNPDAADWWRRQVTTQLLDRGITATWNDNNEYGIADRRGRLHGFGRSIRAADMRPVQPLLMARASRRAQAEHAPGDVPYVVSRAGGAGLQRYAQTWTGDNRTGWDGLKWGIRIGLGLALSGISNLGHDVGGFAGPAPEPELFLRWIQLGIFLPRFSIHSWNDNGIASEPWMYPEILPSVRALMRLRETLVPVLSAMLDDYRHRYEPMLRPLWLDFPDQPECWEDGDAFLVGRDLLVAPVTEAGATAVTARLPAGTEWIDPASGTALTGGEHRTLRSIPQGLPAFLVRSDSSFIDRLCGTGRPD